MTCKRSPKKHNETLAWLNLTSITFYPPSASAIKGWTWGRFCEEAGYHSFTPIRWFEKYSLPITLSPTNQAQAEKKAANAAKAKPLPEGTKPEVKKHVEPIVEAILSGDVSSNDV
jgi:hypothetical protein